MSATSTKRRPTATATQLPLGLKPYHVVLLAHFTAIVVLGTAYSVLTGSHHANLHSTIARGAGSAASLPTSDAGDSTQLPPLPTTLIPPHHALHYWANRKNIVNQLFVKRAWFWTTLAWAAQCLVLRTRNGARIVSESVGVDVDENGNLRPGRGADANGSASGQTPATITSPVAKSTLRWLVATGSWRELFTSWFFGPPLTERILTATGGVCIPSVGMNGEVDASYCRSRSTITSTSHPDIFSKLHLASSSSAGVDSLKPLWRGGHDISGHTFLMVLSALYLVEEIAPFLPHVLPSSLAALFPREGWSITNPFVVRVSPVGSRKRDDVHDAGERRIDTKAVATLGAVVALVALWSWMLFMTALYFHTPLEKLTGLIVAFACWSVLPKGG